MIRNYSCFHFFEVANRLRNIVRSVREGAGMRCAPGWTLASGIGISRSSKMFHVMCERLVTRSFWSEFIFPYVTIEKTSLKIVTMDPIHLWTSGIETLAHSP